MATDITMCNRALALIGADPINAFDDGSTESDSCSALYPMVTEDLLSRYRWRFCREDVQLSRLSDAPVARFDAAYQLPDGIGNVEAVTVNDQPIEFDRSENRILCNATATDAVYCTYTQVVEEDRWPPYFQTCVIFQLASLLSTPIGDREDLAQRFEKAGLRQFALAKTLDAQGKTTKKLRISRFTGFRNSRFQRDSMS